ncbi:hypothetical protein [Winogradskyella aurantiaca]|uniref:hypothetical protein n=1 Tax=Winogradskyella aurantiaca TaxID=2219558 RepID=UPI000E1DE418|nr:hypothetical protein [Winogradskyella aurantiaca]
MDNTKLLQLHEQIKKETPLMVTVQKKGLFTMVRRMYAEMQHNIPIKWRTGISKSVRNGKEACERLKDEWHEIYFELKTQLLETAPELYQQLFTGDDQRLRYVAIKA